MLKLQALFIPFIYYNTMDEIHMVRLTCLIQLILFCSAGTLMIGWEKNFKYSRIRVINF